MQFINKILQDKSNLMKCNVETLTKLLEINTFLIVLNICVGAERPEYGENECDNHQKT
jgi:hypothetical protein